MLSRDNRRSARVLVLSAVFAALTGVGAWISIPFHPVPLTLQTFFVYLSVLVLGRRAFISQSIYVLMGLAGLPVFAKGMSGYGVLLGPTGGFLFGFIVGTLASGAIIEKRPRSDLYRVLSLAVCASLIFGLGWLWLAYWLAWDFSKALLLGVLPFLPGDLLKAGLALVVSRKVEVGELFKSQRAPEI